MNIKKILSVFLWHNFPSIAISISHDIKNFSTIKSYIKFLKLLNEITILKNTNIESLDNIICKNFCYYGIRHDIDVDPITASKISIEEEKLGIKSSYYVLHTANYFRFTRNNIFTYSKKVIKKLYSIQNKGHTIGIHNDCLNDLIRSNIDPKKNLFGILSLLRSHNISIKNISHHSSIYKYNAGNYELFSNLAINNRLNFKSKNNNTYKLGLLNLSDFKLEYDDDCLVNPFIRNINKSDLNKSDLYNFFNNQDKKFDELLNPLVVEKKQRKYDYHISFWGNNRWTLESFDASSNFIKDTRFHSEEIILKFLNTGIIAGNKIVFDIHPMYYGKNKFRTWISKVIRFLK